MKNISATGISFLIVILTIFAMFGPYNKDNAPWFIPRLLSHSIINVCEDRILQRLKAPSSFHRVSSSVVKKRVDIVEYTNFQSKLFPKLSNSIGKAEKNLIKKNGPPTQWQVFVEYDAQNGFGAVVRETALSEAVTIPNEKNFRKTDILLNGKSYFDN